jgi:2-polyprenyl-3-methyl-5-hydroxy-6-metoxy-1,4-benzoquinol methylase
VDERAVSKATELGLDVLHGDLLDFRLPTESFDVVVLNHSLEHMPHPLLTLRDVARILRPKGTIHITVPNGASERLTIQKDSWAGLCFPVHFWFFDAETLLQALHRTGFHGVFLRPQSLETRLARISVWRPWRIMRLISGEKSDGDLICGVATRK